MSALLDRLPTVTKQQIRDDYRGHFAEDIDPADCASVITSGATGVPLRIVHNSEHFVHVNALALRREVEYGLPLDRKVLRPFKSEADGWLEYTVPSAGFLRYAEFGFVTDEKVLRLITGRRHGAGTLSDGTRTDVLRLVKLIERFPVNLLENH